MSSTIGSEPTPMLAASAMPRGSQIRHSRSPRTSSAIMRPKRPTCARAPSVARPRKRGTWSVAAGMIGAVSWSLMAPKSTPRAPALAPGFRRRLLAWFRRHGRDLPWRRTRDPYRVLVSEVMLQQTQVVRVEEFYPRFLDEFPSLRDLAAARPRRVREQWEGLGYYRRAANLHRLARGGEAPPGRTDPRRGRGAPAAPRRGPLHRGGGGELRVRAGRAGGGHQRRAGAPPRVPSPPRPGRARC